MYIKSLHASVKMAGLLSKKQSETLLGGKKTYNL